MPKQTKTNEVRDLAEQAILTFNKSINSIINTCPSDDALSLTTLLTTIRNKALEVMKQAGIKPEEWNYPHKPQELHVGNVYDHALIKLQLNLASFVHSMYLEDRVMLRQRIFNIEYIIDVMAKEVTEIQTRTLTATSGEAKAPLVAKGTRKKGKKG